MSEKPSNKTPNSGGTEWDLAHELIAYFQLAASSISDPELLEQIVDDLCADDDSVLTHTQADVRARQLQFVRNLMRERTHVETLMLIYEEAMDQVYSVGGDSYARSATKLTELEADAYDALDRQRYHEFSKILSEMKRISDHAENIQRP